MKLSKLRKELKKSTAKDMKAEVKPDLILNGAVNEILMYASLKGY